MTRTTTASTRRRLTAGGAALVCSVAALAVSVAVPSEAARLITGGDIKNDSVKGVDVKESTLQGLVRPGHVAAYGAARSGFLDDYTANSSVVSKTFAVPKAGFLHVTGTIHAEDDVSLAGDGSLDLSMELDGDRLSNGTHRLDYADVGAGDSGAMTAVVRVTPGLHTVSLVADEFGTGSFVYGREISAIYVPSGSGFVPPAKPAPARQQQPR